LALSLLTVSLAHAQSDVPIISGGAGFFGSVQGGAPLYQPVLAPVLAAPLGDKWLIESRADLREVIFQQNATSGPYENLGFATLEYLQLDYNVAPHLTITGGRFLTPFGIFNERLSAIWINKFADAPVVAAIGTGIGYSDGFMARGTLLSNDLYAVNYTAYFSTLSTVNKFESQRGTGGRMGLFLPRMRFEFGVSYQKQLQDRRMNSVGTDLSWAPYRVPLGVKGEWAHSDSGHGYWIQAAYRLSQLAGDTSPIGRLEPVFRMQQFFRAKPIAGDSLPARNVRLPQFGLNYYLPHEIRLNGSYTREFISDAAAVNVWEFGITYRFLFPLARGGPQ
jgi:hypothetical protein